MKYVYACISFKNKNEIKDITQTRKYKKAETIARILKADKFVTDVCVGRKRDKDNFEQLISERENVIIVPDITCLGKNNEIARLYNRILESKNDLLVCYFDEAGVLKAEEISTVNLNFERVPRTETPALLELNNFISPNQYKSVGARTYDPRVIDMYWELEQGLRTQKDILDELQMSKNTFARRVNDYIGTDAWVKKYDELAETTDITNTPVKFGGISDEAKEFYEVLKANPSDRAQMSEIGYATVADWHGFVNSAYEAVINMPEGKERDRLLTRYEVETIHLYRQVLKYEGYLKQLQYRKK